MDNEQQIRLERELKFLQESLEADIITKEEYIKGKERIKNKIAELEKREDEDLMIKEVKEANLSYSENYEHEENPEDEEKRDEVDLEIFKEEKEKGEEGPEDKEEKYIETKEEAEPEEEKTEDIQEVEEESTVKEDFTEKKEEEPTAGKEEFQARLKVEDEAKTEEKIEEEPEDKEEKYIEIKEEAEPEEEKKDDVVKETKVEVYEEKKDKKEAKQEKPGQWLKWVAVIAVILIIYVAFKGCDNGQDTSSVVYNYSSSDEIEPTEVEPICSADEDCKETGKIGTCINPGTAEAECEFREDTEFDITILNDKECESCDSGAMLQAIKKLFPNAYEDELDYDSEEGKRLIEELGIISLPSYILDKKVEEAYNFDKFKRALVDKGDFYIISPEASGAYYYFSRDEKKNSLELFVVGDDTVSLKAEMNVNEVLDLFGNDIDFERKIVSDTEKERLAEELGITSYPAFVVNNRLKFGGVRSPESIKEKFCELNELEKCTVKLSEDIAG